MEKWQSDGSQALNYLLLQFLPFNPALGTGGIPGSGAMTAVVGKNVIG
jgi:hypothetical protein